MRWRLQIPSGSFAALYSELNFRGEEFRRGGFGRTTAYVANNTSGVSGGAMEARGGEELVEALGDSRWVGERLATKVNGTVWGWFGGSVELKVGEDRQ